VLKQLFEFIKENILREYKEERHKAHLALEERLLALEIKAGFIDSDIITESFRSVIVQHQVNGAK
jgi:hypothetical protein